MLLKEKNNPEKEVDSRLQKVQGELAFKKNQHTQLQEKYSERGVWMTKLEEQIAPLRRSHLKMYQLSHENDHTLH